MKKYAVLLSVVLLSIVSLSILVSDQSNEVDADTIEKGWFDSKGAQLSSADGAVGYWTFDGKSTLRIRMNELNGSLQPSFSYGGGVPLPWSFCSNPSSVKTIYLENWTSVIMFDYGTLKKSAFPNLQSFYAFSEGTSDNGPYKNSIKSIGYRAFDGCSSLTTVMINGKESEVVQDTVVINGTADGSIRISSSFIRSGVTKVILNNVVLGNPDGGSPFESCSKLEKVEIRGSSTIGITSFINCTKLKEVTIGEGLKTIGVGAFVNCALEEITLPSTFTTIDTSYASTFTNYGYNLFYGCNGLRIINISFGNAVFSSNIIEGSLVKIDGSILMAYPSACETSTLDTDLIKKIASHAIKSPKALLSINSETPGEFLLNGIDLDNYAIEGTSPSYLEVDSGSFKYISTIAGSNTQVGLSDFTLTKEFIDAIGLEKESKTEQNLLIKSTSSSYVGSGCFEGFTNLVSITLPGNVVGVRSYAFSGCISLETVEFGGSITTIEDYAFQGCVNLSQVGSSSNTYYLPNVSQFSVSSFEGCGYNSDITLVLSNTIELIRIGNNAFSNSGVSIVKRLESGTLGASDRTIITLESGSFSGSSIKSFVNVSLNNLPQDVFRGCTRLESVSLEESCTVIGVSSFEGCISLISVDCIGNSIVGIGANAFYGCINLLKIGSGSNGTISLGSVTSIGSNSFYNCQSVNVIFLDSCSSVGEGAFKYCSSLIEIDLKNATRSLRSVDSVSDISTLSSIPDYTFSGTMLKNVLISSSITSVGKGAFSGCFMLESISSIPLERGLNVSGNVEFGSFCFSGTTSLPIASLGITVTIPEGMFSNCTLLNSVSFASPNESRSIGKQAFMNCSSMTTITDSSRNGLQFDALSSIGERAFYGCHALGSGEYGVSIGTSIDTIPTESFYDCAFVKFIIPNSVKTIGTSAIYSSSLINISVPSSVTSIGAGAIKGVDGCTVYVNRVTDFQNYRSGFVESGSVIYCTESAEFDVKTRLSGCEVILQDSCRVSFGTSNNWPTDYSTTIQNVLRGSEIIAPHSPSTGVYALDGELNTGKKEGEAIKIYGNSSFILIGSAPNSVSVSFKSETPGLHIYGEGEGRDVSVEVSYGVSVTIPNVYADTTSTVNPGNFKSSNSSDIIFVPGQTGAYVTVLSDYILQSVVKPYTLTLDYGEYTKTFEYGAGTIVTLPVQSKTGYQWKGWFHGDVLVDNNYTMPASNVTLVSKFTLSPSSVSITYMKWDGSTIVSTLSPEGVYSISIDANGLLTCSYNSDGPKTQMFVARDVIEPGREYNGFFKDGVPFTGSDRISGNLQLEVATKDIVYRITYDFGGVSNVTFKGNTVSSSCSETYTYTEVMNGLEIPFPLHPTLVCTSASIGSQSWSGSFTLGVGDLGSATSIEIDFTFQSGFYAVQFVYNDDSGRIWNAGSVNDEGSITTPSPVSGSKKWYTFSYWYIDGKPGVEYESATVYQVSEVRPSSGNSIVFKAYWEPITIRASFDIDGGDTSKAEVTVHAGSTLSLGYDGKKAGYEFKGWTINGFIISTSSCSVTQEFLTEYCTDGKLQFKAIWGAVGYSIRFDLNGADSPHDYNSFNVDNKVVGDEIAIPSGSDAVKKFQKFQYWSLGNVPYETTEVEITPEMVRFATESGGKYVLTFVMEWTAKDSYTVTYDTNGGSGYPPSDSNRYSVGSSIVLATGSEEMYRDGYQFGGWALDPDSYDVFQTQTFTNVMAVRAEKTGDTLTLYAIWNQQQYKVEYNLDGGFVSSDLKTDVKYGNKFSIPTPFKTGYQFKGWVSNNLSTSARVIIDENPAIWRNGETVIADSFLNLTSTPNATVNLTAVWAESEYIVSYDMNGGEGTLSGGDTKGILNKAFSFPTVSNASKPGYSFSGWSVDRMTVLSTGVFTPEMANAADGNRSVILYAVWTPVEYTIQFRYGDTDSYQTTSAFFNTPVQIETPENVGYKFVGWKSDDVQVGAMFSRDGVIWYSWVDKSDIANGSYFMNLTSQTDGKGIVHLTAVWEKIGYKIIYSANGGTGEVPVDDSIYHVGDPIKLASTESLVGTNGNKIVIGWALESTSTVPLSIDEFVEGLAEKANIANQVTFYAVWIEGSYTVTVDVGDSKPSFIPAGWEQTGDSKYTRTVEYGSLTKDVLADWDNVVLSLDGHVFTGWVYNIASIVTNIDVKAGFEEVSKDLMYYFVGAVSAIGVVAFVFTRFERW